MNKQKQVTTSVIGLALLLASLVVPFSIKANASAKQTAVVVQVTLPNGTWIKARVIENGLLKIEDEKTGQIIGFSMEVLDKSKGTVRVKALEFSGGSTDSFRELETLEVSFKSPKVTSVLPATNIEVLAIAEQLPEKGSGGSAELLPSECCVRCDGLRVCANCYVQMSCGCCNTDRCPDRCN